MNGLLDFESNNAFTNYDRLHGLNISHLHVSIAENVIIGELAWIRHIQGLNHLTLRTKSQLALDVHWVNEMLEAFSGGLTTVKSLEIGALDFEPFRRFPLA